MFHYIKVWYKNFEKNVIMFRSSTPHSETTESGECSEGEMSDLTPCNPSPSLSQLLSWSGCQGRGNLITYIICVLNSTSEYYNFL